jgi:hypothetical protein
VKLEPEPFKKRACYLNGLIQPFSMIIIKEFRKLFLRGFANAFSAIADVAIEASLGRKDDFLPGGPTGFQFPDNH